MFLKHTLPGVLWALFILILCSIPGRDIPHISFLELLSFDKFVHASLFFILVILLIRGFQKQETYSFFNKYSIAFTFVFSIIYGGSLEIMQGTLFKERSADLYDFIANSFGVIIGVLLFNKINTKINSIKFNA